VLPVNPLDKLTNMGGSVLCRDIGAAIVCFVRVRANISCGVCRDIELDFGWVVSSVARAFGRFLPLGAGSIKASGLKTRAT
jgi:hypothetical protein